jgi:hypothetical protein
MSKTTKKTIRSNFDFALAVRSIFLLYLNGKWELLEELGVDRASFEAAMKMFIYLFQEEVPKPLTIDEQVIPLIALYFPIVKLAVNLLERGIKK